MSLTTISRSTRVVSFGLGGDRRTYVVITESNLVATMRSTMPGRLLRCSWSRLSTTTPVRRHSFSFLIQRTSSNCRGVLDRPLSAVRRRADLVRFHQFNFDLSNEVSFFLRDSPI